MHRRIKHEVKRCTMSGQRSVAVTILESSSLARVASTDSRSRNTFRNLCRTSGEAPAASQRAWLHQKQRQNRQECNVTCTFHIDVPLLSLLPRTLPESNERSNPHPSVRLIGCTRRPAEISFATVHWLKTCSDLPVKRSPGHRQLGP